MIDEGKWSFPRSSKIPFINVALMDVFYFPAPAPAVCVDFLRLLHFKEFSIPPRWQTVQNQPIHGALRLTADKKTKGKVTQGCHCCYNDLSR